MFKIDNYLKQFKSLFKKHKDIEKAYLFGSFVKNKTTKYSDVDLAVLLSSGVANSKYSQIQIELISALTDTLNKNCDVIILNNAGTFLKFRVIKEGKIIYEKKNNAFHSFEAKSMLEYFDFLPIRKRLASAVINGIRNS
jgi:predicted nucleotidyltransferase